MIYDTIIFHWSNKSSFAQLILKDKTFEEALQIAQEMGYTDKKWYKPSTWYNRYSLYKRSVA